MRLQKAARRSTGRNPGATARSAFFGRRQDRRALLGTFGLLAVRLSAEAQLRAKVHRIGYIQTATVDSVIEL
jgi:hypothetical protein